MEKPMRFLIVPLFLLILAAHTLAQTDPYEKDTRALIAAGTVKNNAYINQHAGFLIHMPRTPCPPELNKGGALADSYILLFTCAHDTEDGGAFTFSIGIYSWTLNHPDSLEQFVRSLRQLGEQDPNNRGQRDPNFKTIEAEIPKTWSGIDFREFIGSRYRPKSGTTDYVGLTCTHLKDYVLCFRAEAHSLPLLRALLMLDGKLEIIKSEAASRQD
jgi:hypothetical protein